MRRRLILAVVGVLILVVAVAGLWWSHRSGPLFHTVQSVGTRLGITEFDSILGRIPGAILPQLRLEQTSVSDDLVASGFIQADEIMVSTEVGGRVQMIMADVGDRVSSGQIVARLDTTLIEAQIERVEAEQQVAEAMVAQVKAGASQEEIGTAEAAVAKAQEEVALAEVGVTLAQAGVTGAQAVLQATQAELSKLRSDVEPHDLALGEARLELAQGQLRGAGSARDSIGGASERGEMSWASYDAARAAVAQAEIRIRMTQLQIEELQAGARSEDLRAAQAVVDGASAEVEAAQAQVIKAQQLLRAARASRNRAQAQLALVKQGATSAQIAIAQAQVSGTQAARQALLIQRGKMMLRAPREGVVLEQLVNAGEIVMSGSTLFRLADLDPVELVVYVPEADVGRVRLGQGIYITVDSFPGRIFPSRVVYIASRAEFTPRNVQTADERANQVFAVKAELPNTDRALKPGMPADATFITQSGPDITQSGPGPIRVVTPDLSGWGVLQAQQDVAISAEIGGRVLVLGADEGDEVEAGTLLVRLDEEFLLSQIAQAQAAIEAAEANLADAKASAPVQEVEAARSAVDAARAYAGADRATIEMSSAKLRAAEAAHRAAQAKYDRVAAGASDRELELTQLQTELARNELWEMQSRRDAAKSGMDDPLSVPLIIGDFDLGTMLVANPAAPTQWDVDVAEATVSGAETGIAIADLQRAQLQAGARTEDLAIMRARIAQAQAGQQVAQVQLEQAEQAAQVADAQVGQAQAQLDLVMTKARDQTTAVAEAQVAQAKAEAAILEVRRGKLSLQTPIAGVVTQRAVHEGETIVAGARLFIISAPDPVILVIYIPEDRIGRVRVGQVADVRVDAFPDQAFEGQVIQIASRAEFTPKDVRTKAERASTVFAVQIKIANPDRLLRPGMPASATMSDS